MVSITRGQSGYSTTAGSHTGWGYPDIPLGWDKPKKRSKVNACASEKSPLALFAKAEAPRRPRRRREPQVAHLRYGHLEAAVERSLELERPELPDLDETELERLLAKHSDIREGHCQPS
jgi:hypothetical protein